MKKTLIIFIFLLLYTLNLKSIDLRFNHNDIKYGITNTLSGGFTSAIIACFNKPNNKTIPETFLNAFYKGCIGGSLNYSGMKLIQQSAYNNTYSYIWPARFINSFGNSIIYNAANNQKILSSFTTNVFFANIAIQKNKLSFKIDPFTLTSFITLSCIDNYNFDLNGTIKTGSLLFTEKNDIIHDMYIIGQVGANFGNTIITKDAKRYHWNINNVNDELLIDNNYIKNYSFQITCHEIIHSFQYEKYQSFNILTTDKICNHINTNLNRFFLINPNFGILYLLNNINGNSHNYFENEADFFGNSDFNNQNNYTIHNIK